MNENNNNIFNKPIKIIYKVKNNIKQYQYYTYIFVGNVPKHIKTVLNKIKDLDLTSVFLNLEDTDLKTLINYYGDLWFTYFFNKHHIRETFSKSNNNLINIQKRLNSDLKLDFVELENTYNESLYVSKSYGFNVKKRLLNHMLSINKSLNNINFSSDQEIKGGESVDDYVKRNSILSEIKGGNEDEESEDSDQEFSFNVDDILANETLEEPEEQINDDDNDESEDIAEENLYDENFNLKIKKDINKLFNDNLLDTRISQMVDFDNSKDDNIYEDELKNNISKYYIFNQYIYHDDTIEIIKYKILFSIKNHSRFGQYNFILPSRQYLWLEYYSKYLKKYDNIMLGTEWYQNQELLNISVIPYSNIKIYLEQRDEIKNQTLLFLRSNLKITNKDESNKILTDYEDYFQNNEIYLLDVYNEIYNTPMTDKEINNLRSFYLKIYFNKISSEEIQNIINYVDGTDQEKEIKKIKDIINEYSSKFFLNEKVYNIYNDVLSKNYNKINKIVQKPNILQMEMQTDLISENTQVFSKLNLYKIFDEFILDDKYIFVQLIQANSDMVYKFNESKINEIIHENNTMYNTIVKWFDNNKYGLTFKLFIDGKIFSITINILSVLTFKVHWSESNEKHYEDINESFEHVKDLIKKINKLSIKSKFNVPENKDFKLSFITVISKFKLNSDKLINHNHLSEFARLFYPFFSLVIEPKKRLSKIHQNENTSKFGTYLRYKKISNYENINKITDKIRNFRQNYDATENQIEEEIARQFNLTMEKAKYYYNLNLSKYPDLKKKIKVLKHIDPTLKYKTPGIDVSFQGKNPDLYKLKVFGVKNYNQLLSIIKTCSVLLFLYTEIYIHKNPDFVPIKNILSKLNDIAERRFMVSDIVNYSKKDDEEKNKLDTIRINYKPKQGQNYYKRVCQNSGTDQRRRPLQYTDDDIDELIKQGYKMNKATGMYEKKTKQNGKEITLRVVKLQEIDQNGEFTKNNIYYTCSPENNGIHTYIGFLTKSKNPYGIPMPCCFKKDQMLSNDSYKQSLISDVMNNNELKEKDKKITLNEQLYILQDTVKLQANRLGFLPKLLDYYLNTFHNKSVEIKQHILIHSNNQNYYFKYGVNDTINSFVESVAICLESDFKSVIEKCINTLLGPNGNKLLDYLHNGDVKTEFKNIENYINFIRYNHNKIIYLIHLFSSPGLLTPHGLNIIVFSKDNVLDKDLVMFKNNIKLSYINKEEINNINLKDRKTIILYEDGENFFPIVSIIKNKDKQQIDIKKIYNHDDEIISIIKDFYIKNANQTLSDNYKTAKDIYNIIKQTPIKIKKQYLDVKNKVKFFVVNNNLLLPIYSSGAVYDESIENIYDYKDYLNTLDKTLNELKEIYSINGLEKYKPYKIQYDKKKNNKKRCRNIVLYNTLIIPIKKQYLTNDEIKDYKLKDEFIIAYEKIDKMIDNIYNKNEENTYYDDRVKLINYNNYKRESYELFKYHLSHYINEDKNLKQTIYNIIERHDTYTIKLNILRALFYKIINNKSLTEVFEKYTKSDIDIQLNDYNVQPLNKFIIYDKLSYEEEIKDNYKLNNIRQLCENTPKKAVKKLKNKTNDKDNDKGDENNLSYHCVWSDKNNQYIFALTKKMAIIFINKICVELLDNTIKTKEILQEGNYEVSNILNSKYFTIRDNQVILYKKPQSVINPFIEYYKNENDSEYVSNYKYKNKYAEKKNKELLLLQTKNKMKKIKNYYIQDVMPETDAYIRAYANCFYWLTNESLKPEMKNLYYLSDKQKDVIIYLKSNIINWCLNYLNETIVKKIFKLTNCTLTINNFVVELTKDSNNINIKTLLLIINYINNIPILIGDYYDKPLIIIDNKEIIEDNFNEEMINKFDKTKTINIKVMKLDNYPNKISSLYYV